MKTRTLIFIFLLGIGSACSTYNDQQLKDFDTKIESFAKKKKLDLEKSETGLYYQIIEKGEGKPILLNDFVSFKYVGKLLNGKTFDKKNNAIEFQVSQLIAAWQEIMTLLKPGGKAKLICPPQLGYGDSELDDIPKNSILYFEIEVVGVK